RERHAYSPSLGCTLILLPTGAFYLPSPRPLIYKGRGTGGGKRLNEGWSPLVFDPFATGEERPLTRRLYLRQKSSVPGAPFRPAAPQSGACLPRSAFGQFA